jgi:hypothetical protein
MRSRRSGTGDPPQAVASASQPAQICQRVPREAYACLELPERVRESEKGIELGETEVEQGVRERAGIISNHREVISNHREETDCSHLDGQDV